VAFGAWKLEVSLELGAWDLELLPFHLCITPTLYPFITPFPSRLSQFAHSWTLSVKR
jgi:hypothetical protein